MRIFISVVVLILTGCGHVAKQGAIPSGSPPSIVSIGIPFSNAILIVRNAGFEAHDASGLQTAAQLDGFYVELSGDRALLVCRDPKTDAVNLVEVIENWNGPRGERTAKQIERFDLAAVPEVH